MSTKRQEENLSTADVAAVVDRPRAKGDSIEKPVQAEKRNIEKEQLTPLLSPEAVQEFRSRWDALQTGFVDEPRRSVEHADQLVAQVMKDLAQSFAEERARLENQWHHGEEVSTEDLRIVLQRYRSFFHRFLSM